MDVRRPLHLSCNYKLMVKQKTNPQEGIEFKRVPARYNNGMVEYGFLAQDTTITTHGIPYTFAATKKIFFYESGKVEEGTLVKKVTITIHGIPYTFSSRRGIGFYESGKVKGGVFSKEQQPSPPTVSPIPLLLVQKRYEPSMRVARLNMDIYQRKQPSLPTASPIPLLLQKRF